MEQNADAFQAVFDARLELPARLALAYRPDRCLSCRPEGEVWMLRRQADGMPFLLRTGPEAALMEEFRLLNCASQVLPGMVPDPVDCFEQDGRGYLLRSYLPGQNLAQWRSARGGCSDQVCAEIGRQICEMLERLHSLDPPVIHRDIKPENLIMGPDGRLRLIDFGIARQYRAGADRDTKNLGTEGTAAPEQYGFAQTDARTDLYGLGMTLLWLRTGGYDRAALRQASPQLRRALERATEFAPDRRFPSAAELRRALTPKSHRGLLLGALSILAFLALAAGFLYQRQSAKSLRRQLDETQAQLAALQAEQAQAEAEAAAQAEIVAFPSQCLEAAVRAELDRPEGDVTYRDLEQITRLAVTGQTAFSREQAFRYQNFAFLDGQSLADAPAGDISDLSLLAYMPNLKELYLCNQHIMDLSPLAGLPLEVLYLGGNPLADLSPLAGMSALRELNLDGASLQSLTPLTGLPLRNLSLNGIHVQDGDWTALATLDLVDTLSLWGVPAEALEPLPQMDGLLSLSLSNYPAADLTALPLPHLDTLDIHGGLSDLTGVEQMQGLQTLGLANCTVTDLTPLKDLPILYYLCLLSCPSLDYAQLNDLPHLQYVRVPAEDFPTIEAACPGHRFELLSL